MTPEEYLKALEYRERVRTTVRAARAALPGKDFDETFERVVMNIDHGELGEGLIGLAWAIANSDMPIPAALGEALYDLTKYLIPRDDMPRSFRIVEEEEAAQKP